MEPEMRLVKPRLLDDHAECPNVPKAGGLVLELLMRDTDLAKHCCASTLCALRLTSKALLQSVRPHCTCATWHDGALPEDLSKYARLQEVSCGATASGACEAHFQRMCLTRLPGLQKLGLSGRAFTAAQVLLSWQLPALRCLSLSFGFGDAGAAAVARAVLPALEELYLRHNLIGPKGAAALGAGAWPSLHTLDLEKNSIGPEGAAALAAGTWPSLRTLSLGYNRVEDDGVAALVQRFSQTLEKVNFERCCVGNAGARAIGAAEWPFLRHLGLHWNDINNDGAVALAACAFPAVEVVELQDNLIKACGAVALARAGGWPVVHTLRLPLDRLLYPRKFYKAISDAGWHWATDGEQRLLCRPDNLPPTHKQQYMWPV